MRATPTTTTRRRTEEEWDRIAGEYVESGLTQRAFCESRGLAVSSLQWALRRIAQREEDLAASAAVEFIEVEVPTEAKRTPDPPVREHGIQALYEIAFATGTRLRLGSGFDAREAQRLIAILERS